MMNEFSFSPALHPQAQRYVEDLLGGQVPATERATAQLMHRLERDGRAWDNWQVQVRGADGAIWLRWTLVVHWPAHHANGAVLLSPDGCWPQCVNEQAAREVGEPGVALAWFNRVELAFDAPGEERHGPVFEHWPEQRFGAMSVWAWGLQRCVDALLLSGRTQAGHIGVIGHSRGGKTALLAGATDSRIGATIAHNSGTGGAGSLQVVGQGSESLAALAVRAPHWLGPAAGEDATRQRIIETDNLPLLRAIAPRGLCILQASDDAWANPLGSRHTYEQLQPHWAAQGAEQRLAWQARTGGHPMTGLDWRRGAAFLQQVIGQQGQ
jgi:dienelactone hydrolase